MIGGQVADVELEGTPLSMEQILFIHKNKTSALIEACMMIGAVLAVGVFTLLFLLDDTIKSEEDVRRYLQLNTLASIPKEKKRRRASSEA